MTEIPVSPDPAKVDDQTTAVAGKVIDFETASPLEGAWVSTLPRTEAVKTRADGQYVLLQEVTPGQLYTVTAEALEYAPGSAPALAAAGAVRNVDIVLIPSGRAMPVVLDPGVLFFPGHVNAVAVSMRSRSDTQLEWHVDAQPAWLEASPAAGTLDAGAAAPLTFSLRPDVFAEVAQTIDAGDSLLGQVELRDSLDRVAVLQVLAIPALPGQVSISAALEADVGQVVRVGRKSTIVARATYVDVPLEGAALDLAIEGPGGGLVPRQDDPRTDSHGLATIDLDANAVGTYALTLSLPANPDTPPVQLSLEVVPDDACAVDNGGCGPRQYTACTAAGGDISCSDIDECAVNEAGNNACGTAAYWNCVNLQGAAPVCEDLDECAADNGGCGDPQYFVCSNQEGRAPTCADVDACALDNGGCGDPQFFRCTNQSGAPPVCADIDECAVDALGGNGCGEAARWTCTNVVGGPPLCVDIHECTVDTQGTNGCGTAQYWRCTDHEGAAPDCVDVDECATNNGGCNATWTVCVNEPGAPHHCDDIDECAVDNGGCGAPAWWRCVNQAFAPPTCEDIDECAVDAAGINACGVAAHWTCINNVEAPPTCIDRDECEPDGQGLTPCGDPTFWTCTDRVGLAPTCADIDECATGNGGCLGGYELCINVAGALPQCVEIDECLVNNGGCGDPRRRRCIDQSGAAPLCEDVDECFPDSSGYNECGEAAYSVCINNDNAPATCQDLDDCELINGANGCGDPARNWTCVDNLLAAPTCTGCASGTQNLDGSTANGCEYACSPTAETCNQKDDDCDGLVDDGFNLRTSMAHCGACNSPCGPLPNATAVRCAGGLCLVVECEVGFRDVNGDPDDGCEVVATGPTLYVDAVLGSPTGTGTAMDPFASITGALANAFGGETIVVQPGVYAETPAIWSSDVEIRGVDRSAVVIDVPNQSLDGITVRASGATISNLTIYGGKTGILVNSGSGTLLRTRIMGVDISGQQAPQPTCGATGVEGYGIFANNAASIVVTDVEISGVRGGTGANSCCTGCGGGAGMHGYGIRLGSVSGGVIAGSSIGTIRGGTGGNGAGCGGAGGWGIGIQLDGTSGVRVEGNTVDQVDGGQPGGSGAGCGSGRTGAPGVGVRLASGSANRLLDNRVAGVTGGRGGGINSSTKAAGNGGSGSGILVDASNLLTAARNEVAHTVGGAGATSGQPAGNGGSARGIHVLNASNASFTNLAIYATEGGAGVLHGDAACVRAEAASPLEIQHVSCWQVNAAYGSDGRGLAVIGAANSVTVRNAIFADTNGACIDNADVTAAVVASYVDVYACGPDEIVNATLDGNLYRDAPQFADVPTGNLHLLPVSPLIDRADPTSPFDQEPSPNGCAANLGAYGNTAGATAAPGANDC